MTTLLLYLCGRYRASDTDSVRTAERQREGRGERGKMEKNTMKWLSRLRLPKSFHAPIQRAEAEKESTLCLLFAQQPNPAGRQRREKRGKCVGRAGGMGWKTGVETQMGSAEVTLLISFSIFFCQLCFSKHPLFYHLPLPKHTHRLTLTHPYSNTHITRIYTSLLSGWTPPPTPREK